MGIHRFRKGIEAALLCLCALALLLATTAGAETVGKRLGQVLGTFTADGSLTLNDRNGVGIELDFTAGTGTVTFACRLHPSAPYLAYPADMAQCTADCLRPVNPATVLDCQSVQITMASCSSCNVVVYDTGVENRAQ